MKNIINKAKGALVGLACGDAVGTTLEFLPPGTFDPITDMVGGGPFELKAGQWTDDTSMALCLASSLLEQNGSDPEDQIQRYLRWYKDGYMSATGYCFDIGNTVHQALIDYEQTGNAFAGSTSPNSAGNGALMRLAPVAIFYHRDLQDSWHYAAETTRTTHGCEECVEASQLFAEMLRIALTANDKSEIFKNSVNLNEPKVQAIANGSFTSAPQAQMTGTGYVIDSLQSALWCFVHSNSFEQSILMAANLGNDADTTAAICGQIAGAYYGYQGIPPQWRNKLHQETFIAETAERLVKR